MSAGYGRSGRGRGRNSRGRDGYQPGAQAAGGWWGSPWQANVGWSQWQQHQDAWAPQGRSADAPRPPSGRSTRNGKAVGRGAGASEKPPLRFSQGDAVLCNIGSRWVRGRVLSCNVEDSEQPDTVLPYVVKTDNLPGIMPSRTISVPCDEDAVCTREVCFPVADWCFAVHASPTYCAADAQKPLRFTAGCRVAFRVYDWPNGFDRWLEGKVIAVWKQVNFRTQQRLPYLLEAEDRTHYWCHIDSHTLLRAPENRPQQRRNGIASRLEVRRLPDGSLEKFDHVTLRGRPVAATGCSEVVRGGHCDSDSDSS